MDIEKAGAFYGCRPLCVGGVKCGCRVGAAWVA